MNPDLIRTLVQFRHPKKLAQAIPGGKQLPDTAIANLFGISLADFIAVQNDLKTSVHKAAEQLLKNPDFAARVDALPFKAGSVVVGLGDSITDDSCSWLELLRVLLQIRRNDDHIEVVNAGISGDTTVHILSRFAAVLLLEPDWIITLIGTNDARSHGAHSKAALVPDSARNLETLRNWMIAKSTATRVWLTPPNVIEAKIAAFDWFRVSETMWYNTNLEPIQAAIRAIPDVIVDTQTALGANPDFLLADGLHPNLAGQIEIVKAVVMRLSA